MIRSEQLLKEAREQDHSCEFCYYELFDDKAYPCSRCVCNQPTENMWRAKVEDEPQTERNDMSEIDKMIKIVDGILGDDDLCEGCKDGREGLSCAECRRKYADKIIKILRKTKTEPQERSE